MLRVLASSAVCCDATTFKFWRPFSNLTRKPSKKLESIVQPLNRSPDRSQKTIDFKFRLRTWLHLNLGYPMKVLATEDMQRFAQLREERQDRFSNRRAFFFNLGKHSINWLGSWWQPRH
eukprot:Platyproteum_vivax@DN1390_c0_g1_i1.p1